MAKTIKCTNPNCESIITVEEGAMQVICPNCNTWHFPSSHEEQSPYSEPSGVGSYAIPPTHDNEGIDFGNNMAPPSPFASPYNEPEIPAEKPTPSPVPVQSNRSAPGFLMTEKGEKLALKKGKNIMGRKSGDLIIDDRTVSRKHCIIEVTAGDSDVWEYTIFDIGHVEESSSTNGVFVSGRSLRLQDYERIPIRNGTSIRIGNVSLVLQSS